MPVSGGNGQMTLVSGDQDVPLNASASTVMHWPGVTFSSSKVGTFSRPSTAGRRVNPGNILRECRESVWAG